MKDKLLALLKPQASPDVKLSVVSLFMAKVIESLYPRIEALEERQLQKGDKGDRGEKGEKGLDGKPGKDGKNGKDGLNGKDGKNGKDGNDGKNGDSVVDADIDIDDHLVLKLSSGKEIDAGELPMKKAMSGFSVAGNAYQITVATTAPANPQLNDLWLDIS